MATSMNMAVFWDVVQCSLVEIDQRYDRTDDAGSRHL
jgi:hypothetical protein